MADQEMLKEIKRVVETTSRIDERVKIIAESHEKMTLRFDQFLEKHSQLSERVVKLETFSSNNEEKINDFNEKIEKKVNDFQNDYKNLTNRMIVVEKDAPYAHKIVEQSLEALNKLTDRVNRIETDQLNQTTTVNNWRGWIIWAGDWCSKLAWIIIAAYILMRLGLGGVSIPSPF